MRYKIIAIISVLLFVISSISIIEYKEHYIEQLIGGSVVTEYDDGSQDDGSGKTKDNDPKEIILKGDDVATYIGGYDGLTYEYDNGILRVSGDGEANSIRNGKIVINDNGTYRSIGLPDLKELHLDVTSTGVNFSMRDSDYDGNRIFYSPRPFTKVVMSDRVTSINGEFCSGCCNVKDVTLSNNLVKLASRSFQYTAIEYLNIPASLTDVYGWTEASSKQSVLSSGTVGPAFYWTFELKEINANPSNPAYYSENGILYSKDKTILWHYPSNPQMSIRDFTVKSPVTTIANYAFAGLNFNNVTSATVSGERIGHPENRDTTNLTFEAGLTYGIFENTSAYNTRKGIIGLESRSCVNKITLPIDAPVYCSGGDASTVDRWLCNIVEYTPGTTGIGPINPTTGNSNISTMMVTPVGASRGNIQTIILDEGIRQITDNGFSMSVVDSAHATIICPTTLESIGSKAFYASRGIDNYIFKGNAPTIGTSAFATKMSSGTQTRIANIYTHGGWGASVIPSYATYDTYTTTYNYYGLYLINYNTDGSVVIDYQVPGGSTTLPDRTKQDYVFQGWWTSPSGGSKYGNAGQIISFNGDTVLYAQWTPQYCIVSLSAIGGGTVSGSGTYSYGSTVNIGATPNTGYNFAEWSDGDTNATRSFTITTDVVLSALFMLIAPLRVKASGTWVDGVTRVKYNDQWVLAKKIYVKENDQWHESK